MYTKSERIAIALIITTVALLYNCEQISTSEKIAALGEFTHQVALRYPYGGPICSAALISDRWVLSSAFCCIDTPENIKIVVGALTSDEGDNLYNCDTIKLHDEFYSDPYVNNIAALRTDIPIRLSQYIQPIPYFRGASDYATDGIVLSFRLVSQIANFSFSAIQ